ncbi:hypothetical protein Pla108_11160 [Botrimarina colliarenosi]|uniref:Uncharacterized protein n=1 Tax=Botrimarina colliarenosi TaxID=2528001 RepID=A0A5C6AL91_9BACT|nr:hypothetical protein [Botrimarina colliarenosi]TWU00171.1 hypothetical protein Pla108_11160 [Botrimarina colliarenosi]
MPAPPIEQLQRELTDKYVLVTGDRPELARFDGYVGQVKTVNFSGRALVEFTGFQNNPAWFDIDPACLRVVDKPPEPEAPAKRTARPASKIPAKTGASAADVLAAVRGGAKASKPDAAGRSGKPTAGAPKKPDSKRVSPSVGASTADILAAARGGKSSKAPPEKTSPAEGEKRTSPSVGLSTADVLAAARGKKPSADPAPPSPKQPPKQPPAASHQSGMTTEEILAAARAAKKPAAEAPKTSAIDELAAESKGAARRQLTAADIRDIGLGKLSIHREPVVATTPLAKKPRPASADPHVEALPAKVDHTKYTAADILAMGLRK